MSADNYWIVRRHPDGGFAPVMGFMSDDVLPTVSVHQASYGTAIGALTAVMDDYAEYGHSIHAECFDEAGDGITEMLSSHRSQANRDMLGDDEWLP